MILPPLIIPWPAPALWPNSRKHRQEVATKRAQQKSAAGWLAREAGLHRLTLPPGVVRIHMHFHRATRGAFDTDNAVAACKGGLDALAEALGVDDRWFQPIPYRGDPIKGGAVMIVAEATGDSWKHIGDEAMALVKEIARQRGNAPGTTANNEKE